MPAVSIKAKKMTDATVQFISLVERGANRIPFKVVKQEKDMSKAFAGLDLGSIFARKSEKKPEAEVVAVVTTKGEGYESIKKQVAEAGFDVTSIEEMEDGSVVFKQGDFDGEGLVVKINENLALVTKGFSPYNMEMGSGDVSFAEAAAASGFYPGISSIMNTLAQAVQDLVRSASSPSDAQKAVSKLFGEAQAYTNSFLSGLPAKAFKLEGAMPEAVEKEEEAPAATGTEESTPEAPVGEVTETVANDAGADAPKGEGAAPEGGEAATEVKKAEKPAENALTQEDVAAIVSTTVNEKTSELAQKMDALLEGLSGVTKSVGEMQGGIATLSTRVEAAESVAKSAKEAVTGTVLTGDQNDTDGTVTKRDREYQGREIDTAYMPRGSRNSNRH